jgi:hypothetical protein
MTEAPTPWRELGRGAVEAVRNETDATVDIFRARVADLVAALERVGADLRALTEAHRSDCLEAQAALAQPEVSRWTGEFIQNDLTAARQAASEALGLMQNIEAIRKQLGKIRGVTAQTLTAEPHIEVRLRAECHELGLLNTVHGVTYRVARLQDALARLAEYRAHGIRLAPPPVFAPAVPRARPTMTVKKTYDIFARPR